MTFAADQVRLTSQHDDRDSPIVRFIWHHQAGTNDDVTINMMVSGSKKVSATWTVDFEAPVGGALRTYARITAVVPEDRRPWTTASYLDDGALTVECANSSGSPSWDISDESHEACARLAAYAFRAYGVPLQRATAGNGWRGHMGHNEAPDTYATFCPGHLDIDFIITRAQQLVGTGLPGGALSEEDDMFNDDDRSKLLNLYKAVFEGGESTPQGRSLVDVLKNIDGVLIQGGPSVPVTVLAQLEQIRAEVHNVYAGLYLGGPSTPGGKPLADVLGVILAKSGGGADPKAIADYLAVELGDDLAAKVAPLLTVAVKA